MTKAKHKYCGKCLFCTSVCPSCGSTNVEVRCRASAEYSYENDCEDDISIRVSSEVDNVELECMDCGESCNEGIGEYDKLDRLATALDDTANMSTDISVTYKDGKVTTEAQRVVISFPD